MYLKNAHYALELPAEVVLQDRELTEELLAPLQPARGRPTLATLRRVWRSLRGKEALPTCPITELRDAFRDVQPYRRDLTHLYLIRDNAIPVFIPVTAHDTRRGTRQQISNLIRSMEPRPGDSVIAVLDHRVPGRQASAVLHGVRLT